MYISLYIQTWLVHTWDVTYSCVWRDSFMCVTWLITGRLAWCIRQHHSNDALMCDVTFSWVWHDSFTCETWLFHMCAMTRHMGDMTHSHVWHDSVQSVPCVIFSGNITHMFHLTHSCVTWLVHVCDMTHSRAPSMILHSKYIYIHTYEGVTSHKNAFAFWTRKHSCVTWLLHMRDVAHAYVWHDSHQSDFYDLSGNIIHMIFGANTFLCDVTPSYV